MRAEEPEPDLMTAAAALPRTSPAWATVAYHRLRLTPDTAAARGWPYRIVWPAETTGEGGYPVASATIFSVSVLPAEIGPVYRNR